MTSSLRLCRQPRCLSKCTPTPRSPGALPLTTLGAGLARTGADTQRVHQIKDFYGLPRTALGTGLARTVAKRKPSPVCVLLSLRCVPATSVRASPVPRVVRGKFCCKLFTLLRHKVSRRSRAPPPPFPGAGGLSVREFCGPIPVPHLLLLRQSPRTHYTAPHLVSCPV